MGVRTRYASSSTILQKCRKARGEGKTRYRLISRRDSGDIPSAGIACELSARSRSVRSASKVARTRAEGRTRHRRRGTSAPAPRGTPRPSGPPQGRETPQKSIAGGESAMAAAGAAAEGSEGDGDPSKMPGEAPERSTRPRKSTGSAKRAEGEEASSTPPTKKAKFKVAC